MSEANNTPAPAAAASLYPADGGAAAAAAASTLPSGGAADTVAAAAGADTLTGAAGGDTLVSATGANTLVGGDGNDTLAGQSTDSAAAGNDTLSGDAGADSLTAASYTFKLPEGFVGDDALTTAARETFAAAGVAPDKAQGLVDLFGQAMTASANAQAAAHAAQQTTWVAEINSMPEFTGPTRETSLASIGKLFDEFGTPEAKAALDSYGVGNNPALVRMMLKIASTVSEGGPAASGRPTGTNGRTAPKTVGGSLYPDGGAGPTKN